MMDILLDWKSIGSLLATLMFIRTAIRDFLPPELNQAIKRIFTSLFSSFQTQKTIIIIEEFENSYTNELFDSAQSYLSSKCFSSAQILKLSKSKNSKNLTFTMDTNQTYEDIYHGFKLDWSFHSVEKKSNELGFSRSSQENRYFQLSFHPKLKEMVYSSYFSHVQNESEMIKFKNRERKLYTNRSADENGRLWSSVPFSHPSTFDTVAIDPFLKADIKEDLLKFVRRRDFYSRVGRAWKRGYLLYGPPGTGKTSLIASIANFLEFDIYDLELTAVSSNSQLRKLLISTTSKSVIVVEDIDCSLDLSDRKMDRKNENDELQSSSTNGSKKKGISFGSSVSLSGVLNFVDGLWSSCGGERLIIFTTNHKEKLDSALLRPGRMDKHINLSYCTGKSFMILMKNYLEVDDHERIKEVKELLSLVKMTPADVAEIFMSCDEDADMGIRNLIEELKKRLNSNEEEKQEEDEELKKRLNSNEEEKQEEDEEQCLIAEKEKNRLQQLFQEYGYN